MTRQWWRKGSLRKGLGTGGEGNRGGDELNKIMESWTAKNGVATQWGWSAGGKQAWGREAEHEAGEGGVGREGSMAGWWVGAWSLSMSLRQGGSDGGWPRVIERDGQGADKKLRCEPI